MASSVGHRVGSAANALPPSSGERKRKTIEHALAPEDAPPLKRNATEEAGPSRPEGTSKGKARAIPLTPQAPQDSDSAAPADTLERNLPTDLVPQRRVDDSSHAMPLAALSFLNPVGRLPPFVLLDSLFEAVFDFEDASEPLPAAQRRKAEAQRHVAELTCRETNDPSRETQLELAEAKV